MRSRWGRETLVRSRATFAPSPATGCTRFTVGQALAKNLVMVTVIKIIVAFWTHIVKHKCLLIWDNIASLFGAYREKTSILALHVLSHVLQCLWATMLFEKLIEPFKNPQDNLRSSGAGWIFRLTPHLTDQLGKRGRVETSTPDIWVFDVEDWD